MCSVSMVSDFYRDTLPGRYPGITTPGIYPGTSPAPYSPPGPVIIHQQSPISREEFDALRRDVLDMKELLKRAKDYDERNGEPDCEIDEKVAFLRKVAALVGVDLDDVFGHRDPPPASP
jgi:hypothetical protein